MRTFLSTLITGAALSVACLAWAADAEPGLGTWKLNTAKSKFSGPAPQSVTTTFDADGKDGVKWKSERITADGKSLTATYTGYYDGKDYRLAGSPNADTVSLRRIDAHYDRADEQEEWESRERGNAQSLS